MEENVSTELNSFNVLGHAVMLNHTVYVQYALLHAFTKACLKNFLAILDNDGRQ